MNRDEAKQVLLLYRPGTADAEDPEIIQALAVARVDPDLARWFQEHCAFQEALRTKLRQVEAPAHLKAALLARGRPQPQPEAEPACAEPGSQPRPSRAELFLECVRAQGWNPARAWLAAAAAVVLVFGLAVLWPRHTVPDRFANYQATMVSKALREYAMEWTNLTMVELRQHIATRGAPSDYTVTPNLDKLHLTGGATLRWRANPVAMVCFDRGDRQMVFLFVLKRAALPDAPPVNSTRPELNRISTYMTASWSSGDNTYVLAGPPEATLDSFARRYVVN